MKQRGTKLESMNTPHYNVVI